MQISSKTFARDMDSLLTEDDLDEMWLCMTAEAEGDPERALDHFTRAPYVLGSPHLHELHGLVDLGDDAPGWAYSRWVLNQAYRWMLLEHDPRIHTALVSTMITAYPHVDLDRPLGMELREFGTAVAASDWICQQLAVYELGGLSDFLDLKAAPALVGRCDRIREWASVSMSGYRIDAVRRDRLVLTDLGTGEAREALNLGALNGAEGRQHVIGRLVLIDVEPGLMFESRPLDVPPDVAAEVPPYVALEPQDWLVPVGAAREEGRLPLHFSNGLATPLTSDMCPESWGGRCGQDAKNAVEVCTVALIAVQVSGASGAEIVGPHVHGVMVDSGVFAAAREELVSPEYGEAWAILADHVPEPVRSRCQQLSALCRANAA